jgi:hypothetical protein
VDALPVLQPTLELSTAADAGERKPGRARSAQEVRGDASRSSRARAGHSHLPIHPLGLASVRVAVLPHSAAASQQRMPYAGSEGDEGTCDIAARGTASGHTHRRAVARHAPPRATSSEPRRSKSGAAVAPVPARGRALGSHSRMRGSLVRSSMKPSLLLLLLLRGRRAGVAIALGPPAKRETRVL